MSQPTILITGCSSGIGLASARMLRDRGWRVFATARTPEDLDRLRGDERLDAVAIELADPEAVERCASEVLAATDGRLDALFNNAAYGQPGALEDVSREALTAQFEANVFGTHQLTRAIIPAMRRAGRGRIVNCSSVLGLVAVPYRGTYCASKFALEALSDTLRLELAATGIKVSLIEPGPIDTKFIDAALAAARRWIDIENSPHRERYHRLIEGLEKGGKQTFKLPPEAVARKLVHAVESPRPKRRYYVTAPTYVAAVARRALPVPVLDWIASRS